MLYMIWFGLIFLISSHLSLPPPHFLLFFSTSLPFLFLSFRSTEFFLFSSYKNRKNDSTFHTQDYTYFSFCLGNSFFIYFHGLFISLLGFKSNIHPILFPRHCCNSSISFFLKHLSTLKFILLIYLDLISYSTPEYHVNSLRSKIQSVFTSMFPELTKVLNK